MKSLGNKPCPACDDGFFKLENLNGTIQGPYKEFKSVYVLCDVYLYVCNACGNLGLPGDKLSELDAAYEYSLKHCLHLFIEKILKTSKFKQKKLAEYFGITAEYFNQLYHEKTLPSFHIWNMFKVVHFDPDKILPKLNPHIDFRDSLEKVSRQG